MLYAYAARSDVTGNLENFLVFWGELNKAQVRTIIPPHDPILARSIKAIY